MNSSQQYKEVLEKIQNNTKVYAAVLFGSRAKGTSKSNSDYDIAVFTTENERRVIKDLLHLKTETLDIVPYCRMPFTAQTEVFKYGKPLFIKDQRRYSKELYYNIRTYQDNLHHYNILKKFRCIK